MNRRLVRRLFGVVCAGLILGAAGSTLAAQDNQLARTPPMGWNDWYQYECKVSDSIMRANADMLVSTGMKTPATST